LEVWWPRWLSLCCAFRLRVRFDDEKVGLIMQSASKNTF
jgi:hypothetical protein